MSAVSPLLTAPLASPLTRVLVIDDEDLICRVFERVLRGRHEVVGLTSARAALALLEKGEHFDAVFCDVLMPAMCAWDFYDRLLDLSPRLADRTVFLSAGAFTPRAAAFAEKHRSRLIEKPVDPGVIRAVAARLVA